jgi:hypothetical protein
MIQLISGVVGFIVIILFRIFSGMLLIIGATLAFFGRRAHPVIVECLLFGAQFRKFLPERVDNVS